MIIKGIRTHNLKNIDFHTDKAEIIGIYGVSGGGKSSLAYGTVYKLCADTFHSLENGYVDYSDYIVTSYEALIPSIAIKQINTNTNPHSTIYSYLNFSSILSLSTNIEYSLLKLNKPSNECTRCKGSGVCFDLDYEAIIDEDTKLCDIPFLPWRKSLYGNDLKENLFREFCVYQGIDIHTPFKKLHKDLKELLLYAKDSEKFSISYTHNKKKRKKNSSYIGILNELKSFLVSDKKSYYNYVMRYCLEKTCEECGGAKINTKKYKNVSLYNLTLFDFLTQPIYALCSHLEREKIKDSRFYKILSSINKLGIGYLSLNRSIPTLSGGELQKILFAQLIHAKMSGLLVVIDEISAGLHRSDYANIMQYLKELKSLGNTVILIEHENYFLKQCDTLLCLGPKAGKNGGYIIESTLAEQDFRYKNKNTIFKDFINIHNITMHNIKNQNVKFPKYHCTCIVGKCGSGKSSLAKYLQNYLSNCIYLSQKKSRGSIKSSIASYLELNKNIAQYFAKNFGKDYKFFMPNSNESEIVCKNCGGTGAIKYQRGFESSIDMACPECNGAMFNEYAENFILHGYDIKNIYEEEVQNFQDFAIEKLQKFLHLSNKLSLEHLSLNRKISTLSGGELKRIQILKTLLNVKLDNKILIIDEPCVGLDSKSADAMMKLIQSYKTEATIIVEHKLDVFLQADYIIELGPDSGDNGGKITFQGSTDDYYNILYHHKLNHN